MEGALLRVRTLTDVEGSPVSTPGPSPRAVARAPRPRPGKGGVEGEGGVLWPGGVAAEVAEVVVRFVIMNVMTGGCMVLSAAIYFKLLMLLIQFVFAVM